MNVCDICKNSIPNEAEITIFFLWNQFSFSWVGFRYNLTSQTE